MTDETEPEGPRMPRTLADALDMAPRLRAADLGSREAIREQAAAVLAMLADPLGGQDARERIRAAKAAEGLLRLALDSLDEGPGALGGFGAALGELLGAFGGSGGPGGQGAIGRPPEPATALPPVAAERALDDEGSE